MFIIDVNCLLRFRILYYSQRVFTSTPFVVSVLKLESTQTDFSSSYLGIQFYVMRRISIYSLRDIRLSFFHFQLGFNSYYSLGKGLFLM